MSMRQTQLEFKAKKDPFSKSKDNTDDLLSTSIKPDVKITEEKEAAIEILKAFDLDSRYGPCIGLTRMERYNRALNLGLNPDQTIIKFLETYPSDPNITECIWNHLK